MTITRLFALALLFVLLTQLAPLLLPFARPAWRRTLRALGVTVDVAGSVIMLVIIGSVLARGSLLGAALLTAISVPVFVGTYRALPAWWRGQ